VEKRIDRSFFLGQDRRPEFQPASWRLAAVVPRRLFGNEGIGQESRPAAGAAHGRRPARMRFDRGVIVVPWFRLKKYAVDNRCFVEE
jgi:hypothetical protein